MPGRMSVICIVDIGLGARDRTVFLQRLKILKGALIPVPKFILVMGDSQNRCGGPLDASLGCSERDMALMKNGNIKRRLQDKARLLQNLRSSALFEEMQKLGREVTPPSLAHVLVMEALIILLAPQQVFRNHIPLSSTRGVAWTEARHILEMPQEAWDAIARVDADCIQAPNVCTLQARQRGKKNRQKRIGDMTRRSLFRIRGSKRAEFSTSMEKQSNVHARLVQNRAESEAPG